MTTSNTSAVRRIFTLPLIGLLAFTAACSDNSIAGPDMGNARAVGYTVTADGLPPRPTTTTTTSTTGTTTTTTTNSGYTVTADALPPVNPASSGQ